MRQDFEKHLLPVMLIGTFCICAGCCTASPNFRSPAYFILIFQPPPVCFDIPSYSGPRRSLQAYIHCTGCIQTFSWDFFSTFFRGQPCISLGTGAGYNWRRYQHFSRTIVGMKLSRKFSIIVV